MPRAASKIFLLSTVSLGTVLAAPKDADFPALHLSYEDKVLPLLERYCLDCHDKATSEGELDLERFSDLPSVRRDPKTWQQIVYQLETGEMPPRKKKSTKQPTAEERAALLAWTKRYLDAEARSQAGDPGPVVLRRLSNAEYTYSIRDLTGVATLDPTHEFPVDGAAGEGFTNAGEALVMSPALIEKYLGAAKEIAEHAVLLPDGIEFSAFSSRRDKTNDLMARIQDIYRKYTVQGGGTPVNLQGIKFNTNQGGLLPVEKYLAATLGGSREGLSPKYLALLEQSMKREGGAGGPILDPLRGRWQNSAEKDAAALAAEIGRWQKVLWKFSSIGHIGRTGGATSWLEPVTPIQSSQEFSLKLPEPGKDAHVTLSLAAGTAGEGDAGNLALWKSARLRMAGQPDIMLRDVASLETRLEKFRHAVLTRTEAYLGAASMVAEKPELTTPAVAAERGLDPGILQAWLSYLRIGKAGPVVVTGHFKNKMPKGANYDFIQSWGNPQTPSLGANSSDREVRVPGIARPHAVFCHPSPTLFVAAGWQSPVSGEVRIEARLGDAHPECGNGVEWFLQHRTGSESANFWSGDFPGKGSARMNPRTLWVNQGDLLSLIVGPRAGNHSCDLTAIDLTITETSGAKRVWDLAKDVSDDILAGNPHADRHGNKSVWHFYQGEMKSLDRKAGDGGGIPPGSLLAKWLEEKDPARRKALAVRIQALASGTAAPPPNSPDAALLRQLRTMASGREIAPHLAGLAPDPRFGKHPGNPSAKVAPDDLAMSVPGVTEFRIPAALARGREFVVTGTVAGEEGNGQLWVTTGQPPELQAGLSPGVPVIAAEGSAARARLEAAFDEFRTLFPLTLCYERIVPVDEVVTLQLWHREDDHLRRLMLDETETAALDRLWEQLYFVAREPREYLVAYNQICAFSTQDRPDLVEAWKPHRAPTEKRAAAFENLLIDTEPLHLAAVLEIAGRAWRRPLSDSAKENLRALYEKLRAAKIEHDPAIRLTLARIFTSPAFLYRSEEPAPGKEAAPVSNRELATRLSYFLWSSLPDADLRRAAEAGELSDSAKLITQTRRMLAGERTRRLAIQFACQWLGVRGFDQLDEKSERHFPEFKALRESMSEEAIRFFTDFFQSDRSILALLNADHTFVDGKLATFYNLPAPASGWHRVEAVRQANRGGILGMAATLARQSGASRTSPILRGNWISETLLGEKTPKPPKGIPQLPDEVPAGLTERELIARHSSDPACAKCHARIDPYGFALESYDAIGRWRAGADTAAKLPDGKPIEGIDGLRQYLLTDRRDTFVRQFCRKLLGYALGRSVQLSDEPFLDELTENLAQNGYRVGVAIEAVVQSPQFRMIRGADHGNR